MSEQPENTQPEAVEEIPASVMINGGHAVTVRVRNGSTWREERVNVFLVPLSKASEYLDLVGEMAEFIAFVCRKEKTVEGRAKPVLDTDWVDLIHDDDVFDLEAECRKYNDPRIDRWLQRQKATVKRVVPKAREFRELTNTSQRP